MIRRIASVLTALLLAVAPAAAKHHHHHHHDDDADTMPGLAGVMLLVVRHAEKLDEDDDRGLSPAGEARAQAYAKYFSHFALDGAPVHIDSLIASSDSKKSERPRLTLEPLSKATGLPIEQPFANKDYGGFVDWLAEGHVHGTALVAWHHGTLGKLLAALGADPERLLPDGKWPDDVFNWVIVLRYDAAGRLAEQQKIVEPTDLK